MNFEGALTLLKNNQAVTRDAMRFDCMEIRMQVPDSNSKMTGKYLYKECWVQVASHDSPPRVPWIPTFEDLFAEDWRVANV